MLRHPVPRALPPSSLHLLQDVGGHDEERCDQLRGARHQWEAIGVQVCTVAHRCSQHEVIFNYLYIAYLLYQKDKEKSYIKNLILHLITNVLATLISELCFRNTSTHGSSARNTTGNHSKLLINLYHPLAYRHNLNFPYAAGLTKLAPLHF